MGITMELSGMSDMNALEFLIDLHKVCHFHSREGRRGRASSSELRRWFLNSAVVVNGEKMAWDEKMDFVIFSFVIFPKNPVTLF